MENLSTKKIYSTARRIFCCKKPKKTLEDIIDEVWKLDIWDEDNVEPLPAEKEYIEPFQIKGQFCRVFLGHKSFVDCAKAQYKLEKQWLTRFGEHRCFILGAPDIPLDHVTTTFPECYSHARMILEMLLRFSRQRPIARMEICLIFEQEAERFIQEFDEIDPYFPKIPVKHLILGSCFTAKNTNFGLERFFDYEYLSLYHGAQLYPELNTAKLLTIADKQDDPEEIKAFKGWGLAVMEAEANQFSPEILKDQVTEWLETGNCQYKFLCILDEKREIIDDSIIKWALSLKSEPVDKYWGHDKANLRKRLIRGEEEGVLYIFQRNCILFMRGDAICDEFNPLLGLGGPRVLLHLFFCYGEQRQAVQFNEDMFT